MTMKLKLTKKAAEAIGPVDRDTLVWDTEIPGFGLRVLPSGRKTFFLMYRVGRGGDAQKRRVNLGQYPAMSVEGAREMARDWYMKSKDGQDPLKQITATENDAVTVEQLGDRYVEEHCKPRLAARSVENVEAHFRLHINPQMGKKRVTEVTDVDVGNLHRKMRDNPHNANRVLSTLSGVFRFAEKVGIRPKRSNPCDGIDRYEENERERYLLPEELVRLAEVLAKNEMGHPQLVAFIRVLMLSGLRRGEVLALRRDKTDLDAGRTYLTKSKTGPRWQTLGAPVCDVLRSIPDVEGCPYFFAPIRDYRSNEHMDVPKAFWREVRAEAGIPDVRMHDLRHTFGSYSAQTNGSMALLQKLMGHADIGTTMRYAHLNADPVKEEADRVGNHILKVIEGGKKNAA